MKMTESDLCYAIYKHRRSISPFPLMAHNIYLSYWESDVLYVSGSNYATEFEIKLNYQDFKADFKKKTKHCHLERNTAGLAYFYYVCPDGIIPVNEVPEYAGLIYISPTLWWEEIKPAPRRKAEPLKDRHINKILLKMLSKYWNDIDNRRILAQEAK